MNDISDFQRRRGEQPQFDLSALDFNQIRRVLRWALVFVAVILVWTGLRWLGTFYTDWLWFRELGYDAVLVKIVITRAILFVIAVALFLLFALHHGFYGLNNVLTDYIRNDMVRVGAIALSWTVALVLLLIGSYSVIVAGL